MKKMMLLIASMALLTGLAHADPRVFEGQTVLGAATGPEFQSVYITGTRTLDPDTLYTLRGQVYVDSLATLNIPANTFIQGVTAATIIVKRGGKIYCDGTLAEPVIFTSARPIGQRRTGDWGGIVVLGNAPINLNPETTQIEGGIIEGHYGGPDTFDNSGRITYTRIEFPGYRFEEGNEINGLTLGGVGAGTEIHHVQVSHSNDDAFEMFGGTVDMHHLVAIAALDEGFDVDDGYTGRCQFVFSQHYPSVYDAAGTTLGTEQDGRNALEPYSFPIHSNFTWVGPERTDAFVGTLPAGHTHQNMAVLRENTRSSIFNSVMVGFARGFSLRDGSIQAAADDILKVRNTSVTTMYSGYNGGAAHDTNRWADIVTWFGTPAYGNYGDTQRMPSTVGLTDMSDLTNPQPQPELFSELDGSADFNDSYLDDAAGRYSFVDVGYRGAFEPGLPMDQQWTAGWTNFDPDNTDYVGVVAVEDLGLPAVQAQVSVYPNPFNPKAVVRFAVPRSGNVSLKVYDVAGREVSVLHQGALVTGQYSFEFSGENLSSGTYFARLVGDGFTATQKMQLVK